MSIPIPSGILTRATSFSTDPGKIQFLEREDRRFWFVSPASAALVNKLAESLHDLSAAGAEPIKQNPLRQVWRMKITPEVCPAATSVFVKISRPVHGRETFKQFILGTASGREWRNLLYAQTYDIPAIRPLALAEEKSAPHRGANLLVTQAVENAHTLNEVWPEDPETQRPLRQDLLLAVADTLARAHQAGLCPADLHPGNLLVQMPAEDKPQVCLVDLYKASVARPVSDRQVVQAFVALNQWFRRNSARTERVRFTQLYLRQRDLYGRLTPHSRNLGLDLHDLVCAVARQSPIHAERLARVRDRRIFGDGRYFTRLRFDDGRSAVAWLTTKHPGSSPVSHLHFTADTWRAAIENRPDLWAAGSDFAQLNLPERTLKLERCWAMPAPQKGRGLLRHRQLRLKGRWLAGQVGAWAALWHEINRSRSARWPLLLLESPGHPAVVWLAGE